jgi:hypothetical protein
MPSYSVENRLPGNPLVIGNASENRVERANTHRSVIWNREPVRGRLLRLQDNLASRLID